jgi:hypothetical protein
MEKEKYFLHIFMIINLLNSISSETAYILMDHLFGQIQILDPICLMKDPSIVSVRGTVENLDDIIKIDPETELYENPYVYISEIEKLKYVNYFWDKTIFFTNFQISWDDIRHSICFVQIEKYYKYNYI